MAYENAKKEIESYSNCKGPYFLKESSDYSFPNNPISFDLYPEIFLFLAHDLASLINVKKSCKLFHFLCSQNNFYKRLSVLRFNLNLQSIENYPFQIDWRRYWIEAFILQKESPKTFESFYHWVDIPATKILIHPSQIPKLGPRRSPQLIPYKENQFIIFGGEDSHINDKNIPGVWIYNLKENTAKVLNIKGMPKNGLLALERHSMILIKNRYLYLFGGLWNGKKLNQMWKIDLDINTCEEIQMKGDVPPPICDHSYLNIGEDKFWIFGGTDKKIDSLNDSYIFDTNNNMWSKLSPSGPLPSKKSGHSCCRFSKDLFIIYGGGGGEGGVEEETIHTTQWKDLTTELHYYSVTENRWFEIPFNSETPDIITFPCQFSCGFSLFIFFGGSKTLSGYLSDKMYRFDMISRKWNRISKSPWGPIGLNCAFQEEKRDVLFFGESLVSDDKIFVQLEIIWAKLVDAIMKVQIYYD